MRHTLSKDRDGTLAIVSIQPSLKVVDLNALTSGLILFALLAFLSPVSHHIYTWGVLCVLFISSSILYLRSHSVAQSSACDTHSLIFSVMLTILTDTRSMRSLYC